ncbi:hypothetical protein IWQ56_006228, partial [Coemansia nantahalensis]
PPLASTQSPSSRSQAIRLSAIPESPPRARQSMGDIRLPPKSPVAGLGSRAPQVARIRSKSLDLGRRHGPPSRRGSDASSTSSESSVSVTSASASNDSTAATHPGHNSKPLASGPHGQHPGCLHTVGKELVDFLAHPATPQSASPRSPVWDKPCTPT